MCIHVPLFLIYTCRQLGGIFIVNPKGKDFLLAHKEEYAGDRPSRRQILETLGFSEETLSYYKTSTDAF